MDDALQEHPWHAAVVKGKNAAIDVWAGAGQGEAWDEEKWGRQVSLLMGDGFFHRYGRAWLLSPLQVLL